jgi:hypothetical protein
MEARRVTRLRRLAWKQGYVIRKDRARTLNLDHQGGYMVIDANPNVIVTGARYDLDLDDLETFLGESE